MVCDCIVNQFGEAIIKLCAIWNINWYSVALAKSSQKILIGTLRKLTIRIRSWGRFHYSSYTSYSCMGWEWSNMADHLLWCSRTFCYWLTWGGAEGGGPETTASCTLGRSWAGVAKRRDWPTCIIVSMPVVVLVAWVTALLVYSFCMYWDMVVGAVIDPAVIVYLTAVDKHIDYDAALLVVHSLKARQYDDLVSRAKLIVKGVEELWISTNY